MISNDFHGKYEERPVFFAVLDPAGYDVGPDDIEAKSLTTDCAAFVVVLHTSTAWLGYALPKGHVDVYVNYGRSQPSCCSIGWFGCSHTGACFVFSEMIAKPEALVCYQFTSYAEIKQRRLASAGATAMRLGGILPHAELHGTFVALTSQEAPYLRA